MDAQYRSDQSTQQAAAAAVDGMEAVCREHRWAPYLLLDRADTVPLALDAGRMRPVPDPFFAQEPHLAPQLVALSFGEDGDLLKKALAVAVRNASQRLSPQAVAGVLLAQGGADAVLAHLTLLSHQYDPTQTPEASRVFRYQDPRVMQRVWPVLTEERRRAWLGPVRQWHAALQPQGPWLPQSRPGALFWSAQRSAVSDSEIAPFTRVHRLMEPEPWRLAHSAPAESAFWRLATRDPVSGTPWPDTGTLRHWLHEADALGLAGNDVCDWALCRWVAGQGYWEGAPGQQHVQRALALQRQQAALGFADAWRIVANDTR